MQLTTLNTLTMTSREIAELTGKNHSHVMRDIRALVDAIKQNPELDSGYKVTKYAGVNGQEYEQYELDKDTTLTLLLGYDAVARMKVVKRWQELEDQAAGKEKFYIPSTLSEALQLAADQARIIEEQRPKVEVYEKLAERKGDVSTTILAKQLGTSAIKLNQWLRDKGIKWKNADLPMAGYMDWFNIIADVRNGHEFSQCLITPLGQIEIAKRFTKP